MNHYPHIQVEPPNYMICRFCGGRKEWHDSTPTIFRETEAVDFIITHSRCQRPRIPVRRWDITMTCGACPSQWEGTAVDGESVYIRYRYDRLTVSKPYGGETIFVWDNPAGDGWGGCMGTEDMQAVTAGIIEWID